MIRTAQMERKWTAFASEFQTHLLWSKSMGAVVVFVTEAFIALKLEYQKYAFEQLVLENLFNFPFPNDSLTTGTQFQSYGAIALIFHFLRYCHIHQLVFDAADYAEFLRQQMLSRVPLSEQFQEWTWFLPLVEELEAYYTISREAFRVDDHEPLLWKTKQQLLQNVVLEVQQYQWIGFDVDHTVVQYHLPELHQAQYIAATEELRKIYPSIKKVPKYRRLRHVAKRGIAMDKTTGNVLEVSPDQRTLRRAYHGLKTLNPSEVCFDPETIEYAYTWHEVVIAPVYCFLVEQYDQEKIHAGYTTESSYEQLFFSAKTALMKHLAQPFMNALHQHPEKYIRRDDRITQVLRQLQRLPELKDRLFILTNSNWEHCDYTMKYCYGEDWTEFFQVVIVNGAKASFFTSADGQKVLFRRGNWSLDCHKFAAGTAHAIMKHFREILGSDSHDDPCRVLYFGDHPMQDVMHPQQNFRWDTIGIASELEEHPPPEDSLIRWCTCMHVDIVETSDKEANEFFQRYVGSIMLRHSILCLSSIADLSNEQLSSGQLQLHALAGSSGNAGR